MIAGTNEELLARLDEFWTEAARIESELRRRNDVANQDLHDFLYPKAGDLPGWHRNGANS